MWFFIQISQVDFNMATGGGSGKGKKPITASTASTQWPQTRKEFVEWFWNGTNGNQLIKELNTGSFHRTDYIRREKDRPTVYCIGLNDGQFPGKNGSIQRKLCKVGFTHVDTTTGTNNRMEDVMKKICSKYESKRPDRKASAGVLFVLSIGAVDTTPYLETEKRIRAAVGWPINKGLAKELGLPCSTEWVLTTQAFIDKIKASIIEKKEEDPIDLFKTLKYRGPKPPSVWLDENGTVVKFTDL